jgi:hypothetical protein
MSEADSQQGPIPISPGPIPPAPPGMVAIPAAALSGRHQNAAQHAGGNIGVMAGIFTEGGSDFVTDAVAGNFVGQQIGRYQRTAAMHDPNAPMVFVDVNSRAGRRAIRRQKRQQRRSGRRGSASADKGKSGGWFKRWFGGGSKSDGDKSSSEDEGEEGKTEKKEDK